MTFRNFLTLFAGVMLAGISLFFSATGLIHLFAGAGVSIAVMAIAFEIAKVSITVYLLGDGKSVGLRAGLGVALLCLVTISSLGIYGYLGKAYNGSRVDHEAIAAQTTELREQIEALAAEHGRLYQQLESIPAEHSTNKTRMYREIQPRLDKIAAEIQAKNDTMRTLVQQVTRSESDIGELRFAAELVGTKQDGIAKFVISVLAFLLDPLAVMLVMASGVKGPQQQALEEPEALVGYVLPTDRKPVEIEVPREPGESDDSWTARWVRTLREKQHETAMAAEAVPALSLVPDTPPEPAYEQAETRRLGNMVASPALHDVVQKRKSRSRGVDAIRTAKSSHPRTESP